MVKLKKPNGNSTPSGVSPGEGLSVALTELRTYGYGTAKVA